MTSNPSEKSTVPAEQSGGDGEGRRHFLLSAIAIGWCSFAGAVVAMSAGVLRFVFPNVLFEPPQSFNAGSPDAYADGQVSVRWKQEHGIWIVREGETLYALVAYCTHLGCTPNWQEADQKFKCPCHGSGFHVSGIHFEGPAPRPLERCAIALSPEGNLIVNKGKRYLYEKGQWSDPGSFVQA
jgi:cytochrome b6-f complex iron-sulfur subunit